MATSGCNTIDPNSRESYVLSTESAGQDQIRYELYCQGSSGTFEYFCISCGAECDNESFAGSEGIQRTISLGLGETVYVMCIDTDNQNIYLFPVSEKIISDLGGP